MLIVRASGGAIRMRGPAAAAAFALLAFAMTIGRADAEALHSRTARGPWVEPAKLQLSSKSRPEFVANGTEYLLFDRQIDLRSAKPRERYTRVVKRYVDELGLRDGARIEIAFDPAFERVLLHSLTVTRGGARLERLSDARIEVLAAAIDDDSGAVDGTRTLLVEVGDLRIGDVVDYEYTLVGSNPAFGHHGLDELRMGWEVPVERFRHRLLFDADARLAYRAHGNAPEPTEREASGHREWVWEGRDLPGLPREDRLPEWYRPYPWVEISDFATWPQVAAWARRRFDVGGPRSSEIAARARQLTRGISTEVAKAAALLRFVQEDVRYVALELGAASHVPATPEQVIERRYGDCKDKALTLAALLDAVGIRADVALSSTREGPVLDARLPSPLVFDHAVVRVRYGEGPYAGRSVWLDPTLLHQRGTDTAQVSRARGFALPLTEGDVGLERIDERPMEMPSREIEVQLRLGRGQQPTLMTVDTLLRGESAEEARRELQASPAAAAERAYRDFYAGLYPGLESAEPLRIDDDDDRTGELRMRESYELHEFWRRQQGSGSFLGELFPLELAHSFDAPRVRERAMPLRVEHPSHVRYTIRAEIDLGWAVRPETVVVENEAMRLERSVAVEGDALVLRYDYRTKADHVAAVDAREYVANLDEARRLLSYAVARPVEGADGGSIRGPSALNWPKVFAASTLATFGFAALSFALSLRLRSVGTGSAPLPIGGWLCVALIVLVVSCASIAHDLIADLLPVLNGGDWARLTASSSGSYHPFWAPYLLYAAMARVLACASLFGVILLFLRRSRRLPPLLAAVAMLLFVIAALEADSLATVGPRVLTEAHVLTPRRAHVNLILAAAFCVIGVPYLLRSRRVRRTFIR